MAEPSDILPEQAQPPNPFLEPRNWGIILMLASSAVPWLTAERVAQLAPLIAGILAYVFGLWQSSRRHQVVKSTVAAVAKAVPGETVVVPLPSGGATLVRTDASATPQGVVGENLTPTGTASGFNPLAGSSIDRPKGH